MNREKAKAAFEKYQIEFALGGCTWHKREIAENFYLAGAEWAWGEQQEKIDEHLHYIPKLKNKEQWQVEIEKLQADLKSVNFSYWKKCEEVNRLQQAVSEAREIFKDELVYCFPESNHWHGEIKKWLEKYGDNSNQ